MISRCRLTVVKEAVSPEYRVNVSGSRQVFEMLKSFGVAAEAEEVFVVLGLDTRHKISEYWEVSRGSLNESIVHPREVFKRLLVGNCHACILAHNHPSGDPAPSSLDIKLTERLVDAGKLLGLKVLDHVIVGDECYYSFAEQEKL